MNRLSNSFAKFLNQPSSDLTPEEAIYFEIISLLTTLIPFATTISRSAPVPPVLAQILQGIKTGLETLLARTEINLAEIQGQLTALSCMHGTAMFRDAADATRRAAQWILAHNDRQREHDRSGSSTLPKDVAAQINALLAVADGTLKEGKKRVGELRQKVVARDFDRAVERFVFEGHEKVREVVGEERVGGLVQYWEVGVKGWMEVKWV